MMPPEDPLADAFLFGNRILLKVIDDLARHAGKFFVLNFADFVASECDVESELIDLHQADNGSGPAILLLHDMVGEFERTL